MKNRDSIFGATARVALNKALIYNRRPVWVIFVRPCLVHPENQKVFKILRHIVSFGTCMKH